MLLFIRFICSFQHLKNHLEGLYKILNRSDYKGTAKLAPQFTKTPMSVVASKGDIACFCARVQCGKPMEITWTINGKDVKENPRCKVCRFILPQMNPCIIIRRKI